MSRAAGRMAARDARPAHRGVGRQSSPAAEQVSDALRRGDDIFLAQRRRAAALTTGATAALGIVALYQFGLVDRVPEPSLPGLDADRVDASGEAYRVLLTPDSALGIASYGLTLVLVGMGGAERAEQTPWVPLAAAGKVALDAASALWLFAEQVTQHRRVCSWCTVAAVLSVLAVPASLPEAGAALHRLRRGATRGRA